MQLLIINLFLRIVPSTDLVCAAIILTTLPSSALVLFVWRVLRLGSMEVLKLDLIHLFSIACDPLHLCTKLQ